MPPETSGAILNIFGEITPAFIAAEAISPALRVNVIVNG